MPLAEFAPGKTAVAMLKGTLEEQLAAARQMQTRNITLAKLNLRQRDLPAVCQHSLRSLGVIRRMSQAPRDWIAERLAQRYGVVSTPVWRSLFDTEYEHVLQILIEADAMFEVAPSNWLQLQDSFSDAAIRQLIAYLRKRRLAGGSQNTVDRNGRLVRYGNILQPSGPLGSAHPGICASLLKVHERRNTLPGSHPYDQKGGAKNTWLNRRARDRLVGDLRVALSAIVQVIINNP
jgi:hypothetical protein